MSVWGGLLQALDEQAAEQRKTRDRAAEEILLGQRSDREFEQRTRLANAAEARKQATLGDRAAGVESLLQNLFTAAEANPEMPVPNWLGTRTQGEKGPTLQRTAPMASRGNVDLLEDLIKGEQGLDRARIAADAAKDRAALKAAQSRAGKTFVPEDLPMLVEHQASMDDNDPYKVGLESIISQLEEGATEVPGRQEWEKQRTAHMGKLLDRQNKAELDLAKQQARMEQIREQHKLSLNLATLKHKLALEKGDTPKAKEHLAGLRAVMSEMKFKAAQAKNAFDIAAANNRNEPGKYAEAMNDAKAAWDYALKEHQDAMETLEEETRRLYGTPKVRVGAAPPSRADVDATGLQILTTEPAFKQYFRKGESFEQHADRLKKSDPQKYNDLLMRIDQLIRAKGSK